MSTNEPLCIETALLPQNGDQSNDAVSEKPVEEPATVAASATAADTAAVAEIAKNTNATTEDILPEQDDKLDEFARLELELAELNKSTSMPDSEDDGKSNNTQSNENTSGLKSAAKNDSSELTSENEMCSIEKDLLLNANLTDENQNGKTSNLLETHTETAADVFDHEDLIAVLKGESTDEPRPNEQADDVVEPIKPELPSSSKSSLEQLASTAKQEFEGVTIEGEGEYQIMEVVDDFEDDLEANVIATAQPLSATAANVISPLSQKLTKEEERAVAMEQIANLKRPPRRRKQDIKPLPVETSELVSTLGADWSDDGDDAELVKVAPPRPTSSKTASATGGVSKTQNTNLKKENVSGAQSAQQTNTGQGSTETKATASKTGVRKRRRSTGANVTSVIVLPSQQETINDRTNVESPVSPATGFKRTRTIKRRIIWDPDAPETAISYADLVRGKSKDRQSSMSPSVVQNARSTTPKEKQKTAEMSVTATTAAVVTDKKPIKRATTPSVKSNAVAKDKVDNHEIKSSGKQALRRSQTASPVANGGSAAATVHAEPKKKKISEIDRLMGDEGAASMLSSLESELGKLTNDSDDDKPHKPLMRSRTGPTEKANKQETTPAAAAVQPTPPAKKPRMPKAKPSASWDYVYQKKQQLSDDSMIIRRRSNSSYSSNASQHRLSIDGPIAVAPSKAKSRSSKTTSEEDTEPVDATSAEHLTKQNPKTTAKATAKDSSSNPSSPTKSSGNVGSNKRASPTGENVKSFEFLKPKETKKNTTPKTTSRRSTGNAANADTTLNADMKKATPKRGRQAMTNKNKETTQIPTLADTSTASSTVGNTAIATAMDGDTNIVVRKTAKFAQIVFNTHTSKISGTFTPELMNQLVEALDTLAHDANCNVIVLLTNGPDFCRGLDLSSLAAGAVEQRKAAAISLATAAKNLLKTIATFPKPLVAGINGSVVGLGVTLLPLMDVVISSDKATLETPYAKIGQVPEGFCIWQNLWNVRTTAKTKLFWLAEKLISTEAVSAGLVTKLTAAEKVNDDAIATAKKMSHMSMDAYRYMKKATIQSRLDVVISAIDDEFEEIIKQWTSSEYCAKIKKYIESGGHFTLSPKQN